MAKENLIRCKGNRKEATNPSDSFGQLDFFFKAETVFAESGCKTLGATGHVFAAWERPVATRPVLSGKRSSPADVNAIHGQMRS